MTKGAPDELTVHCGLVTAPDGATKMVAVPLCHCGELAQAETDVRPLRSSGRAAVGRTGSLRTSRTACPTRCFPTRRFNYWKSAFFSVSCPTLSIATLLECSSKSPPHDALCVIEPMGGAAARVASRRRRPIRTVSRATAS